jgi:predicted amidophosphoribosyltransferase
MICPYCGNKIKDNSNVCGACGKEIKGSTGEKIEVEYKEFKVSELLEIHRKPIAGVEESYKYNDIDIGGKGNFKESKDYRKRKILIFAVIFLVILIVVIFGLYTFKLFI